jgi:hypothetical protein
MVRIFDIEDFNDSIKLKIEFSLKIKEPHTINN